MTFHSCSKKNGNDKIFHWTPAGLKRWLLNPVLQGHTAYNKRRTTLTGQRKANKPEDWDVRLGTHSEERLLTDQEAGDIKEIIEFNAARRGTALLNYDASSWDTYSPYAYLRGLVFCAECQAKATSKTRQMRDGTKYFYYACRHAGKGCNNLKGTRKEFIEAAIIHHLLHQSIALESLESTDLDTALQPPGAPTSEKLQKLEARLAKLEEIADIDPDLEELKQKTRQQIQEELNPFSAKALETRSVKEIIQAGNNLMIWKLLTADEKVLIYPRLIDHIRIRDGAVDLVVFKD